MTMPCKPLDPLDAAVPASALFGDWISRGLDADFLAPKFRNAGGELAAALTASPTATESGNFPSPLFSSSWVAGWAEAHAEDFPDDSDRSRFHSQVVSLRTGELEVVVTGQQPGFLGGPLYTLFKVATALALAKRRTAAGRPTVAVFWSGDDDDDLAEAFDPVAWMPQDSLVRGGDAPPAGPARAPVLGRMREGSWKQEAGQYLEAISQLRNGETGQLARDLAELWNKAAAGGWDWSRLSRRAILRVFSGHGLIVVSGDDSGLHAAAAPLYRKILTAQGTLAQLAEERGRQLSEHGWHAQINARSLARPLFAMDGDHRTPVDPGQGEPDFGLLRPGVMLRSPVQDWLLRPAAVVVGPGELSYLRQLDSLYADLEITRPPLVPRLFAWLLPAGFDPGLLAAFRNHPAAESNLAATLAEEAEAKVRLVLEEILEQRLGLEPERARSLSAGRARRWSKGVAAMLRGEIKQSRLGAAAVGPQWVFPGGGRQERRLAYLGAAALWGEGLVAAGLAAASTHLEEGLKNNWREFSIQVPDTF